MQNSVRDDMTEAYEGMLYGYQRGIDSGISTEQIYFGKGVSRLPATNVDQIPPDISMFKDGEVFAGIAIADTTLERRPDPTTGVVNAASFGSYLADKPVGFLRRGRIWVVSDTEVADISKGVYVKDEDNVGTAATITSTTHVVSAVDGDSFTVTITGYAVQTVTFTSAAEASVAAAAAEMNSQLVGCSVTVTGGAFVISTDAVGSTQTIAATDIASEIEWDTPVAGTGDVAGSPANSRGSFRNFTLAQSVAGFTEVSSSCKWLYGKTISTKYFGLLEVNL